MKRKLKLTILGALIAGALMAQTNYKCALDGSMMYFTGETRIEWGKMLKLYRCAAGHSTWIISQ